MHPLDRASAHEPEIRCPHCGASYAKRGDIIDFIPGDDYYWGEIDQDQLRRINHHAEEQGDWYGALCRNLTNRPRLIKYITQPSRLGWLFHCYDEEHTDACLDVGSGWGVLSFGLSRFYKTVYSLDRVYERLRFQSIRARQDGTRNIRFLRSDFLKLPIPDQSLDLVALNGVLEWVGMSDHGQEPGELQKQFLREVARVLKPTGRVYLGIENRTGLPYFLGHRDHSGLPFTSLVPRRLADEMVRSVARAEVKNTPDGKFFHKAQVKYRTYTYTLWGYRRLLEQAGFTGVSPYWVWQSYSYPRISGSMDAASIRYAAANLGPAPHRGWQRLLSKLVALVPADLLSLLVKLLSPDFLIIAGRSPEAHTTLQDRILSEGPPQKSFVRISRAASPTLETNYVLLDGKSHNSKSIRVAARDPGSQAGDALILAEEQGISGRLIRPSDKDDITLAARWLAGFQGGSKKGEWQDQQLADEIRWLTSSTAGLPGFEGMRQPLKQFERKYLSVLSSTELSVVSEHGDFRPLNLVVTPEAGLCPADWHFSTDRGVPFMDIGAFYLSLLRRTADGNGGKGAPDPDGPLGWFVQGLETQMQIPFGVTPVYYLLRVIQRIKDGHEAALFESTAYAELGELLQLALNHSLSLWG
jgi:SAM-dependent methyltransferase